MQRKKLSVAKLDPEVAEYYREKRLEQLMAAPHKGYTDGEEKRAPRLRADYFYRFNKKF